jgi:hypothetical protein
MQDKTESICKVENLHKWAFSLKGIFLKCAVWNAFNIKIFLEGIA